MANSGPYIGIDLGGTNMQIGVVDHSHQILGRVKKKTQAGKGADAVIQRLATGVEEACEEAKVKVSDLVAVGIGAPGAIDHEKGIVLEAPNLRWNDFPLAETLSARLGNRPVIVDNDVNAAVYGENRLGIGGSSPDVLGVWVGTGVGGGLILGGELYHGFFGTAGEIGHTVLLPGAPMGYSKVEECCSRKYVSERLAQLILGNHPSLLSEITEGRLDKMTSGVLKKAYEAGDELTVRVMHEAADLLGLAIANYVTVLSLPLVIMGGGLTEALGAPYVDRVAASVREHVFPARCEAVKVVATKLADNAGLLGAALLAHDRLA